MGDAVPVLSGRSRRPGPRAAGARRWAARPGVDGPEPGLIRYCAVAAVSFKVSDDEAALIRTRARREGSASVFAAPADRPPLTTEAVRGLLADFP